MKTTLHILSFILLISLNTIAQEAGKKGKLIANEIKTTVARYTNNNNPNSSKRGNQVYNWNYNYNSGYSEVFLRIPENGYFTVTIDDQVISNGNGKYRFFDLNTGNHILSISTGRSLIFKTRFSTFNNTRMILDFFTFEGLFLLHTEQLAGQELLNNQYGSIWNNFWNGYYTSHINSYSWEPNNLQTPYNNNNQNNHNWNNQNNFINQNFEDFYKTVKSQSFNDTKIEIITAQSRITRWRTEEIKRLLLLLSFENDKLEVAKVCYQNCIDKQNYFNIYGIFTFESSITELNRSINSGRK